MKHKSKILLNILVILIVLTIVLYFSLKDNYEEIIKYIQNMSPLWLIISILFLIGYRSLVGVSSYFVTKGNDCQISLLRAIQINFIILFFHGVTPFAGGGQPMEIYYLHNEKIPITKSTNIVLQNFIIYQTALIIVGFFALIYNAYYDLFPTSSLIKQLVLLGFVINFLVWIFSFIISFGKRFNKFFVGTVLTFLGKIKIIKDVPATRKKLNEYLTNFHENAIQLKNKKALVVTALLLDIASLVCLYSIPFAIIQGVGVTNVSLTNIIVATTYVMVIGSFVPIPGGTGGLEYGFIYFYGFFLNGSLLTAVMLVWRFISYYLGMIIGAILLGLYRKKV